MSGGGGNLESSADFADRIALDVPGARIERVHRPSTIGELEDVVADAAGAGEGLLIGGGLTRIHIANPARGIGAFLSTRGITGVDEFEPEEGVLHARTGTTIAEIQSVVAGEGWELPLDPPGRDSTLGGTIGAAATGPRSQAFGAVEDAILGLEVVDGHGVASKCGGRVVKNVTGYDLAKLYCGSFGSLAVVTGAWLRLRPAASTRSVLVASSGSTRAEFEACRDLAFLGAVRAFVWEAASEAGNAQVAIELGGSAEGVEHDRSRIAEVLDIEDASLDRIDASRDARATFERNGVVLRARVLGTNSGALVRQFLREGLSVSADPGLGVVHAHGPLDSPERLAEIRRWAQSAGGFATFEVVPEAWRDEVDVFGGGRGPEGLIASLKSRFDPKGILNPGRFVAGT